VLLLKKTNNIKNFINISTALIIIIIYSFLKKTYYFYLLNIILFSFIFSENLNAQNTNPNGYNVFYHSNGKVASEGFFKNGLPDGVWKTYNDNGVLIAIGKKNLGLNDSIWIFYTDEGKLKSKFEYAFNQKNGCAIIYDSLEHVKTELFYLNDTILNEKIEYYPTGEIKSITNFINGKADGLALEFSKDGDVISEIIYDDGFIKSKIELNRYDSNGNKTGYWRVLYPDGTIQSETTYKEGEIVGYQKLYDKKGRLTELKNYNTIKGKSNGEDVELIQLYKEFYPQTVKPKIVGGFYNGMKQGMFREYDLEGQLINGYIYKNDTLIAEGLILPDGTYNGEWKYYYPNGTVASEGTYINGKKNGLWTYYYENGKKQQVGKFKNDSPVGEWKWFYPSGSMKKIEYYNQKGLLEGTQVEYDEQGNEIAKGEYYNGLKEGDWFYHVGDFKEVGQFTLGYKNGMWSYYYKNGKLAFKGEFDEGQPKGKHIYYHKNGVKKEKGKYKAGLKDGFWKTYNEMGEVIEILKYKNGQLISINGVKVKNVEE
jgi:antitoxin component YwqK of YwqJK toxin-antitoxin module